MGVTQGHGGRLAARLAGTAVRVRGDIASAGLDLVLAAAAYTVILVLRFDGAVPAEWWERHRRFLPVALGVLLVVNAAFGLYGRIWRHASVLEARRLLTAGALALVMITALVAFTSLQAPQSVVFSGTVTAVFLQGALRYRSRLFSFHRRQNDGGGLRVIVLGAGEAGSALVRDMLRDPSRGLVPVAILDDEPRLHGRVLHGVRVRGSIYDLVAVAGQTDAHQAYLAIGDPSQELVRLVADLAEQAGVALRVLPLRDAASERQVTVSDVRDLRITDLLGRQQVQTDLEAVNRLLHGRRVLVTGAGGSIGSEVARQVSECGPSELVLLEHDETHLHDALATMLGAPVPVLADIRDREVVLEIFRRHRPEVVFHAAAHKHVPLLEDHPAEAVKTNVLGTRNLLAAADMVGTDRFVFISTDKAVRPSSVMGASKQVGEQLLQRASTNGRRYSAVRFGNVLGSRGSVIPTFVQQIRAGGPVTLTDPRMTRYFMSIPEAVQLVLQAATMAEGGEVFMLEMGEPVRILDLATKMIRLSGRRVGEDVEIRVSGVRPGEKLEEELRVPEETAWPTEHPAVLRLRPVPLARDALASGVDTLATLAAVTDRQVEDVLRTGLFALARGAAWTHSSPIVLPERRHVDLDLEGLVLDLTREEVGWTRRAT